MTAEVCTDDQLAAAMLVMLRLGPGWRGPVELRAGRWQSSRPETKQAFALRFPAGMDRPKKRKGRTA